MKSNEGGDASYPVSELNQVKRRHDRGSYDHATVHALLDAAMMCHVSYVIDGQPFCTPTFFWREGVRLYWHGSSASRMLRNLAHGEPACLTVTHLDALVLARSGFNHSADYRSVMAFGNARLVEDPQEKERALVMMVDRLYPQRTAGLRPTTAQEIKATSVIAMDIERTLAEPSLPADFATLRGLVNNAGLALGINPAQGCDLDQWETMVDTNIKGLLYVTRAVLPGMVARDRGHVVQIGSIAGQKSYPGGGVYCATKAALAALATALAGEYKDSKLHFLTVYPGPVETPMAEKAHAVFRAMRRRMYPMARPRVSQQKSVKR